MAPGVRVSPNVAPAVTPGAVKVDGLPAPIIDGQLDFLQLATTPAAQHAFDSYQVAVADHAAITGALDAQCHHVLGERGAGGATVKARSGPQHEREQEPTEKPAERSPGLTGRAPGVSGSTASRW